MANSKPVGVAYSDPALVAGTTIDDATITDATITGGSISGVTITGGDITADSITATDASLGISGLAAAQGGAIVSTGGTSSTSANAGGAVSNVGGTPGATGVGGAVSLTGGAALSTDGNGGSVIMTGGALAGTGFKGSTYQRGYMDLRFQAAPTAKTVTAAITAAELVTGIITTTGATGPSVHQLPTGTLLKAQFPAIADGDSFDFSVINTGTGASDDATITVNTDVTIVGNATIGALTDATIISGSGRFRAKFVTGVTWIVYRLA